MHINAIVNGGLKQSVTIKTHFFQEDVYSECALPNSRDKSDRPQGFL